MTVTRVASTARKTACVDADSMIQTLSTGRACELGRMRCHGAAWRGPHGKVDEQPHRCRRVAAPPAAIRYGGVPPPTPPKQGEELQRPAVERIGGMVRSALVFHMPLARSVRAPVCRRGAGRRPMPASAFETQRDRQHVQADVRVRDSSGSYRTVRDWFWVDVESRREYDRLRVEMANDQVIAIEESNRRP